MAATPASIPPETVTGATRRADLQETVAPAPVMTTLRGRKTGTTLGEDILCTDLPSPGPFSSLLSPPKTAGEPRPEARTRTCSGTLMQAELGRAW